jgi:hypothetical protein
MESLKVLNIYMIRDDPDFNISKKLQLNHSDLQEIYDIFYPKTDSGKTDSRNSPKFPDIILTVFVPKNNLWLNWSFPLLPIQTVSPLTHVGFFADFHGDFAYYENGFIFMDSAFFDRLVPVNIKKHISSLEARFVQSENAFLVKDRVWVDLIGLKIFFPENTGYVNMKDANFKHLEFLQIGKPVEDPKKKLKHPFVISVVPPSEPLTHLKSLNLMNCVLATDAKPFLIGGDPNRDIYIYLTSPSPSKSVASVQFVTSEDHPYQQITFDGKFPVPAKYIKGLFVSHLIVTNVLPTGELTENPSVRIFTCKYCDKVEINRFFEVLAKFENLQYSEIITRNEIQFDAPVIHRGWEMRRSPEDVHPMIYSFKRRAMSSREVFPEEYLIKK